MNRIPEYDCHGGRDWSAEAAVIAISNDEAGISEDPDVRFAVAEKIVERAAPVPDPAGDGDASPSSTLRPAVSDQIRLSGAKVVHSLGR